MKHCTHHLPVSQLPVSQLAVSHLPDFGSLRSTSRRLTTAALCLFCLIMGCNRPEDSGSPEVSVDDGKQLSSDPAAATAEVTPVEPQIYEIRAEALLAARLPSEEASAGWIRLFDGQTLFGWQIAGDANFRIEEGNIVADGGNACLMCTSIPWRDYELVIEFKAQQDTNSGIFLRTPLDPQDPTTDCYEVNIAPDDNPFPTASLVGRKKADLGDSPQPFDIWRKMKIRIEGDQVTVDLDDELVCQYTDPDPLPEGRIGLQHNQGRIAFRSVMLRPLGLQSLLDNDLAKWKQYPEMDARFTVNENGELHIQGGSGQLETNDVFGDFVLLAEYKLPAAEINSGIFFRSIPGDKMMGYECQLSNEMKDANPLIPADCGTGGIFRRQDARLIAGEVDQWATVVLVAQNASMAAWVNGIQVSDWYDDREPDENPRRGKRIDPGTFILQGHDPNTDALIRQFAVVAMDPPN